MKIWSVGPLPGTNLDNMCINIEIYYIIIFFTVYVSYMLFHVIPKLKVELLSG